MKGALWPLTELLKSVSQLSLLPAQVFLLGLSVRLSPTPCDPEIDPTYQLAYDVYENDIR